MSEISVSKPSHQWNWDQRKWMLRFVSNHQPIGEHRIFFACKARPGAIKKVGVSRGSCMHEAVLMIRFDPMDRERKCYIRHLEGLLHMHQYFAPGKLIQHVFHKPCNHLSTSRKSNTEDITKGDCMKSFNYIRSSTRLERCGPMKRISARSERQHAMTRATFTVFLHSARALRSAGKTSVMVWRMGPLFGSPMISA